MDVPTLDSLSVSQLKTMNEAADRILECYRILQKSNSNIVAEILRGQGEFVEFDHYPEGDIYDNESHSQYYYHAHRADEHGHFHTFLREAGMDKSAKPIQQSHEKYMDERDDTLSHLIAISMNNAGYPIGLFAVNRWVTAENWYSADDVIEMLDRFEIDLSFPSWPANIWLTAMLQLFRPEIESLIINRDQVIQQWQDKNPDNDVFEDRALELTGYVDISVERQISGVRQALADKQAALKNAMSSS